MTQKTSLTYKSTLILSTAMAFVLSSLDVAKGDNTHFTDKVANEASAPTPVQAKAAEFQKVLQDFEGESRQNVALEIAPEANPEPTSQTQPATLASSAELQPIVQPLNDELPQPKTKIAEAEIEAVEKEAIPVPELIASNETPPLVIKGEVVDFSSAQNGRSPLGILESNRDLGTQQWYLYSSAKRGIKAPTDIIEIVSVVGENTSSHRGEDVKALLIEKGIKPENIKLITATGEEGQAGKIYIFGK